jgi:ABC-type transporter Mla subunit MlaD
MKPALDPGKEMQRRKWRIALTYALTTPLAAGTAAVTLLVSGILLLLGHMLWGTLFLLFGTTCYVLIVANTLRDEEQIRRVLIEELYPERSADLRKLRGKYATIMQEALDDRKRIERAIQQSPEPIRRALSDTIEQVATIVDTVYEIAYKAQSLEESLGPVDAAREQRDIARLRQAIDATTDPFLREQYEATLETKQELLDNLARVQNAVARWHAQLERALTTLDNLYSQVLMIRSAEIRTLTEASDVVSKSLREQLEELRRTVQAMDTVFGAGM